MLEIYKEKNIVLNSVKKLYKGDLNKIYYSVYCSKNNCSNFSFNDFSQCALHCQENKILSSKISQYYEDFLVLLINNIKDQITTKIWESESDESIAKFYDFFEVGLIERMTTQVMHMLESIEIIFEEIYFPSDMANNSFEIEVLKYINLITYTNCVFNTESLFVDQRAYFIKCEFLKKLNLYPFLGIEGSEIYHYNKCIFKNKVWFQPSIFLSEVNYNVFQECFFESDIVVDRLHFKKNLFKLPNFNNDEETEFFQDDFNSMKNFYSAKIILIKKCIFDLDFKLNGFDDIYLNNLKLYNIDFKTDNLVVKSLKILDTKFESKLEIKNRVIQNFEFKNSNVEKVFDSFESRFEKSYFYKSIFTDFAGFEKVEFGLEDQDVEAYQAKFIYTTFMSFSNFRQTKFHSGLDFENSNLKEQPNFLKTEISSKNTNRETFRIVKHSFDNVGNKIEANKFYSEEMDAYRREMKGKFKPSERFVFCMNNFVSEFGTSYLKPILLLIILFEVYIILLSYYGGAYSIYGTIVQLDILDSLAKDFLLFSRFLKAGFEFVSLIFYILSGILIWQIAVAIKRHTQR